RHWLVVNVGVLGRLRRLRPDVVIVGGWNQPAFWQAGLYARLVRVPLVVWVESTARDERAGRRPVEAAKRALVRSAAGFVGPGRERVAALAGPSVRLLGRIERDELVDWYAAADAFVMPSRSETWGMAMQEAAAAGLPLIASEAPGAGYDLIEEGVNGFRVPVGDVEALRRALTRVATDESFRERARPRTLELARGHTPE